MLLLIDVVTWILVFTIIYFELHFAYTSHHHVLDFFFENLKMGVRFSIGDPPAKPAKQNKQVSLEKSLRLHTRGSPTTAAEAV